MDKTTVRTWDPTAPSLLWAHQIRRENIHLVNQLDSTRADLAGAISSINELKQQLNELREQAQAADTNANTSHDTCDRKLKDILERLETRFEGISCRVDVVESENARLRERADGVERGCSEHTGMDELREVIRRQVLDEVRGWFTREKESLQCPHGNDSTRFKQVFPEPDVIPDSMRLDESTPFARKESLRTLTETTWGSSSISQLSSSQFDSCLEKQRIAEPDSIMLRRIRQGGRDLGEYLTSVERLRDQLPPRKREGGIVEAFVRGLDDAGTRRIVEGEMDRAGWSWNTLAKIVRRKVERQHGQAVALKRAVKADVERMKAKQAPGEVHMSRARKKQRRFIPIVPADEDDLIV